jgi:hypothetical protein
MIRDRKFKTHLRFMFIFTVFTLVPFNTARSDRKINDDTGTAGQFSPAIAMHPYGPAVICWKDNRLGTDDIYFQLYGRRGQPFGTLGNVRVNDDNTPISDYSDAVVAMDRNGHFVIGWTGEIVSPDYFSMHVYARWYLANGSPFGGIVRVDDGPEDKSAHSLSVASDDTGNTVAVWTDRRRDENGDIFAQLFDPAGRRVGTNVIAHALSDSIQYYPSVAMNGTGYGVVVWGDDRSGVPELYARRFGLGMKAKGSEFSVGTQNLYPSFFGFLNHDVVVQPDGSFAVCWLETTKDDHGTRYLARLYSPTGAAVTTAFRVDEEGKFEDVWGMRIAPDPSGGYTFVWTGSTGEDLDIYARSCDAFGDFANPSHAVNDLPGDQNGSDVAADDNFNKIFVWTDHREGNWDIYGTMEGINRPTYLTAGSGFDGMVPITWEPYYGQADPSLFKIYKADSPTSLFILTATVNSPNPWIATKKFDWIDTTAENGKQYYYYIKVESSEITSKSMVAKATPSSEGHVLRSEWTTTSPAIDGFLSAGEWDDAAVLDISSPDAIHPVRLYVKNSGSFLYLAVDDSNDLSVEPTTALGFLMDLDHNQVWDAVSPSDEGAVLMTHAGGATFHAFWGTYPDHLGASAPVAAEGIHYISIATSGHVQHEAAIDLSNSPLKAIPGDTIGFAVWSMDPGNFNSYAHEYGIAGQWPTGTLLQAAETLGDLILADETSVSDWCAQFPESFILGQNYPNPFNPATTIPFRMKESCRVVLKVYDIGGRQVASLADGWYAAGSHSVRFNASRLPSGIYLCRIQMGNYTASRKMAVVE